jgi:hypothetical protein
VIGRLLIDAPPTPAAVAIAQQLANDVLDAGRSVGYPEIGPLGGVFVPAGAVPWSLWVTYRSDWACTGLVSWPEHELGVVLGDALDRLMAPPREEVAEPETDPLLRAVAEDQRRAALAVAT